MSDHVRPAMVHRVPMEMRLARIVSSIDWSRRFYDCCIRLPLRSTASVCVCTCIALSGSSRVVAIVGFRIWISISICAAIILSISRRIGAKLCTSPSIRTSFRICICSCTCACVPLKIFRRIVSTRRTCSAVIICVRVSIRIGNCIAFSVSCRIVTGRRCTTSRVGIGVRIRVGVCVRVRVCAGVCISMCSSVRSRLRTGRTTVLWNVAVATDV